MSKVFPAELFDQLTPPAVWRHFATLCQLPRPSKGEEKLRDHLIAWAKTKALDVTVDPVGNLILKKPASVDGGHLPATVLQAHLDMVCQERVSGSHDWQKEPICPVLLEGWLTAEETTLGADNGIGVALILAVLEDSTLTHGPIEALLTIDEESGMGGARGLPSGLLSGRRMLNLDTEAWGEFFMGCAGGLDVDVQREGQATRVPEGCSVWNIGVRGLRGGHSGVNIHEGRANAIKLLLEILVDLEHLFPFHLVDLVGGSARNAIPREAFARIALSGESVALLQETLAAHESRLGEAFFGIEQGIQVSASPDAAMECMSSAEQRVWLHSLHAAPYGVWRMSQRVPGVVETSNNLGMVRLTPVRGDCNFMVRSLLAQGAVSLGAEIASLFALTATPVKISGEYPGWAPNPDSRLLALCQQVFGQRFGKESSVRVIHAGLECGLIGAKYPGMDIVSFGPNIRGAHAPGEAVEVASVDLVWQLLIAILATPDC